MSKIASIVSGSSLWQPSQNEINNAAVSDFATYINKHTQFDWHQDFQSLWEWSVNNSPKFWSHLWDWHGIIGDKGNRVLINPTAMPGAEFFPDAHLNFAENLLVDADDNLAISAHGEDGRVVRYSRIALKQKVMALAGWLQAKGVTPGDRVAAYTPNVAEAVITMLATAALGAVYSSCSPDFGAQGVCDRFGQIQPKILLGCDGYYYGGKKIDRMPVLAALAANIPSIKTILVIPYVTKKPDCSQLPNAVIFDQAIAEAKPLSSFQRMPFNAPLYILYSSGTTGAPKCIVHGIGGTLIQHIKEHRLHTNIGAGDKLFYFTTCGWMMWNWLVSALATKASIVLYDGNPAFPGPERLWCLAESETITTFGTSAKYIDFIINSGYIPRKNVDLSSLRNILSTGSPLSYDGFAFVYSAIKTNVQLCSISGGTDIVACFVLGCPVQPVLAGEIQTRGLGMKTDVLDENGNSIVGLQGELCCTAPFPSMPIKFWNDSGDQAYKDAYFKYFPDIWRHGDWATITPDGGIIIHGRSDATLNPGGVRIGTAEIYRQVEAFDNVLEALVVGQKWLDDERVILFVKLASNATLDNKLQHKIRTTIRNGATPRHVPEVILAVPDIPRTRSGKISELAVRNIIHNQSIKNREALINVEALEFFKDIPELQP